VLAVTIEDDDLALVAVTTRPASQALTLRDFRSRVLPTKFRVVISSVSWLCSFYHGGDRDSAIWPIIGLQYQNKLGT
jgi:hypothetical protein